MPLKNSGHFLNQRSHKPSLLPTPEEEAALAASATGGPSFVLHTSIAPNNPSSQITYGLTIHHAVTESEKTVASSAAIEPKKMSHAPIVDAHIEDTQVPRLKPLLSCCCCCDRRFVTPVALASTLIRDVVPVRPYATISTPPLPPMPRPRFCMEEDRLPLLSSAPAPSPTTSILATPRKCNNQPCVTALEGDWEEMSKRSSPLTSC
ncbi:hypothetical protein [Oryza sativa Japonica Group]|uniref:Uncharacterized protein P0672D08.20 n=1 Tax=Oryza sativa subsp. japonica TaxID=39947 RepID=Q655L3_ORYSJ|nr:hypothetical protein [Oryza sativa Japonica Group]